MRAAARRNTVMPLLAVLLTVLASLAPSHAADGPLEGRFGIYTGGADGIYPAWSAAVGSDKDLLAKIALQPRVRWFGSWVSNDIVAEKVREYITQAQGGDLSVVVPMATFRLWPRGEAMRHEPLSDADLAGYRQWVDNVAQAIGSSRVLLVVEPDLAVALPGWRPGVRLRLARYSARVFSALPNTTTYLDASDSDWLKVPKAARMLRKAGVEFTRGFALGATHYTGTAENIAYGAKIARALRRAGISGKHFVVDTADNGRPFTATEFKREHPGGDFDNADVCLTPLQQRCVTLGIPPTTNVTDPRWGLPAPHLAARHVDAFLWFGRPWLYRQATPFSLERALAIARTTPYS